MPKCRVCYRIFDEKESRCPRCGFRETSVIGDLAHAEKVNNSKAEPHRLRFLDEFEFGVTAHYWKDENGTVVPDRTQWLSFGTGGNLLEKHTWLDQQFARIPDAAQLALQLEVRRGDKSYHTLSVTVPSPRGAHLQQVGIVLSPDMTLRLLLKNPQEQTQSAPVKFLKD